jgi:hypothetical protein
MGERGCAAAEVSTGREEERLVGSTVPPNAWLILCHEAVQINKPNRPHQIPIHSIYVLSPTPATRTGMLEIARRLILVDLLQLMLREVSQNQRL